MKRMSILAGGIVCLAAACGGDDEPCDPVGNTGCEDGLACEVVEGGEPACFAPVVIRGDVFDLEDTAAVEGARVVALDANRAAASTVGVSDADGRYEIQIPSTRDASGVPVGIELTLRADADGYESFPGTVRQALPIDTGTAVEADDAWVVDTSATDVGLFSLPADAGSASITGHVDIPRGHGAIVVAENASGTAIGYDAVVDIDGDFAILNLPAGDYTVAAYAQGLVHETADVTLSDGGTADVELGQLDQAAVEVTGQVTFANAPGGATTSVVIFVESTFNENLMRGASPPGIIAVDVAGSFTLEGVPPGRYVVLAAFENDALVRDPDPCIAGTEIVHVEVLDAALTIDQSFKVTGALELLTPEGGGEVTDGRPVFSWVDDSSEDAYRVECFDSYGLPVWMTEIPGVSGENPTVAYDGATALPTGWYQVRVTSLRSNANEVCMISTSEDLRGVFYVP